MVVLEPAACCGLIGGDGDQIVAAPVDAAAAHLGQFVAAQVGEPVAGAAEDIAHDLAEVDGPPIGKMERLRAQRRAERLHVGGTLQLWQAVELRGLLRADRHLVDPVVDDFLHVEHRRAPCGAVGHRPEHGDQQITAFAKQLFLLGRDAVDFRADLVQPPAVKFLQVAERVVVAQRRVEHAEGIGRVDRQRVAVIKLDHLLGQREEGLDDAQQLRWGGAQVGDMGGVEVGEALPDQRCGLPAVVNGGELFTFVKASLQLTHFASLELTHPDH